MKKADIIIYNIKKKIENRTRGTEVMAVLVQVYVNKKNAL